jgi:hypothetical protein
VAKMRPKGDRAQAIGLIGAEVDMSARSRGGGALDVPPDVERFCGSGTLIKQGDGDRHVDGRVWIVPPHN